MKKHKIENHANVPTPNLAQFDGYGVGLWCPSADGTGPVEAVVLHIDFERILMVAGQPCSAIGLRLKSRHAVNVLIELLERYRDEAFPLA